MTGVVLQGFLGMMRPPQEYFEPVSSMVFRQQSFAVEKFFLLQMWGDIPTRRPRAIFSESFSLSAITPSD